MHNPWKHLDTHHPEVDVVWMYMDGSLRGYTDGRTIWMDCRLTQVQRRVVVCHETIHIEQGLIPATDAEEEIVRRLVAERLIELPDLIEVLRENRQPYICELAEALWVDEPTIRTRLENLRGIELAEVECALDLDWSVA